MKRSHHKSYFLKPHLKCINYKLDIARTRKLFIKNTWYLLCSSFLDKKLKTKSINILQNFEFLDLIKYASPKELIFNLKFYYLSLLRKNAKAIEKTEFSI